MPNVSKILTHRFYGLGSVHEALTYACKSSDEDGNMIIKVVVNLGEGDAEGKA